MSTPVASPSPPDLSDRAAQLAHLIDRYSRPGHPAHGTAAIDEDRVRVTLTFWREEADPPGEATCSATGGSVAEAVNVLRVQLAAPWAPTTPAPEAAAGPKPQKRKTSRKEREAS